MREAAVEDEGIERVVRRQALLRLLSIAGKGYYSKGGSVKIAKETVLRIRNPQPFKSLSFAVSLHTFTSANASIVTFCSYSCVNNGPYKADRSQVYWWQSTTKAISNQSCKKERTSHWRCQEGMSTLLEMLLLLLYQPIRFCLRSFSF